MKFDYITLLNQCGSKREDWLGSKKVPRKQVPYYTTSDFSVFSSSGLRYCGVPTSEGSHIDLDDKPKSPNFHCKSESLWPFPNMLAGFKSLFLKQTRAHFRL